MEKSEAKHTLIHVSNVHIPKKKNIAVTKNVKSTIQHELWDIKLWRSYTILYRWISEIEGSNGFTRHFSWLHRCSETYSCHFIINNAFIAFCSARTELNGIENKNQIRIIMVEAEAAVTTTWLTRKEEKKTRRGK